MLIAVNGLSKVYATETVLTRALSEVDLRIAAGEYVSIEGPSGCGKSTLLSILGLLDEPSTGHYALAGVAAERLAPRERARLRNREIGFVFQNFNLLEDLSVAENVALPLRYRGMSGHERQRRVGEALERVGMAHRAGHRPVQLSGGQQQRVAVARAIAGEPSLLLADEPTGNLDSENATMIMDLLDELHVGGATIVMVTHDPRFASRAQRAIKMIDGQIVGTALLVALSEASS
jgi:putative ABC transport system ATP-binding protein